MTPQRYQIIKSVLDERQPDLTVIMDGVHKPHNFNAIIRSCDAVGVFEAHYVPVDGAEKIKLLNSTAKGTQKYVSIRRHDNFSMVATKLKNKGYKLVAAHVSENSMDFKKFDYTQPCGIVLGAELEGVSENTLKQVDAHIQIPLMGMVESLNVSVAAALILYEAQRQRFDSGQYDKPSRLSELVYKKTLFEWCWPKAAMRFKALKQPYPEMDEEGYFKIDV